MALLNQLKFGNGGGLFPEYDGSLYGAATLPPDQEALLAQNAREVAAARLGRRRGGADMSLFDNEFTGQQLLQQLMPQFQPSGPALPQAAPAAAIPPQLQAAPQAQASQQYPPWMTQMQGAGMPMAPPQEQSAIPPAAQPAIGNNTQQSPNPATVTSTAMPPQQSGGVGAVLQSLFGSPTLVSGIGNAITAGLTGQRADPTGVSQRNQQISMQAIYQGLISAGKTPAQAMAIASAAAINPAVAQAILPEALGTRKPSGTLKIGNLEVPYLIGENGQANLVLPGGGNVSSLQDLISFQQRTEAESKRLNAAAEAGGKVMGETAATLPASLQRGQDALTQIDELLKHKGFNRIWGIPGALPDIPGGDAAGARARVKQIGGQVFLEAFNMLKGGGQITEVEGAKATAAKARLDSAQSPEEARIALQDLSNAIRTGMQKLKEQAGQAPITPPVNNGGWTTVPNMPGVRIRERQ